MRLLTWLLLVACATPVAAEQPLVDRGNVTMPERISGAKPVPPPDYENDFVTGRVTFQVEIDAEGHVRNPHVLRVDDPRFADWALPAISEWRYRPATQAGEPVSVAFTISVRFDNPRGVEDRPARLYRRVEPDLSEEAKARIGKAAVVLSVEVADDGRVKNVEVVSSGDSELADAAVAAVRRWAYVPAIVGGKRTTSRFPAVRVTANPDEPTTEAHAPVFPDASVTLPEAVKRVHPEYTADMLARRLSGGVTLLAVIHKDGSVGDIRVLKADHDALVEPARKAVAQWRYKPAMLHGEPIEIFFTVIVRFRIDASTPRWTRDTAMQVYDRERKECYGADFAQPVEKYDEPPELVDGPPPETPVGLRAKSGDVSLRFDVCRDGSVGDVFVVESTYAKFNRTAMEAVRGWKFRPATAEGRSVPSQATVKLHFASKEEEAGR